MKDGDVVLLQNTRFRKEETKNEDNFSKELASLCDVYVMMLSVHATEHIAQQQALQSLLRQTL